MNDNPMHYCPGCSHGVVHKLIYVCAAAIFTKLIEFFLRFMC